MRDNLLTAITRRKDSPPTVANLAFARLLYGPKHPYGWPMAGVEASIKKLTPAPTCAPSTTTNYRPEQRRADRRGRHDRGARCARKLEAAFGKWRAQARRAPQAPGRRPAPRRATRIFLDRQGRRPAVLDPRRPASASSGRAPTTFPVTVMNLILGGGFYRLDLNLREGKGWTYGARSTFDSRRTPGPFSAGGEFVAAAHRRLRGRDPERDERHARRRRRRRRARARQGPDHQVVPRPLRHPRATWPRSWPSSRSSACRTATSPTTRTKIAAVTQGRRPPRGAQVPRPRTLHDRRRRRQEDRSPSRSPSSRRSSCAISTANPLAEGK